MVVRVANNLLEMQNILFPFNINSTYSVRNISEYSEFGFLVDGKEKIDLSLGACGCFMLGFKQHEVIEYVSKKMIENPFVCGEFHTSNESVLELANKLYALTGYKSFFSTSGSDAIETAIKLSGIYHNNKKKRNIIGIQNAYHGSTFLVSGIGNLDYMVQANGKSSRCIALPFINENDFLARFSDIPGETTAAIVIESCSWSIGLITYSKEFWKELRRLCDEKNILLIIDDVAMCGGKTGNYIGFDLSIQPDMFCLGKGFSGGYFPLTACMFSDKIYTQVRHYFFAHGYTHAFSMSGVYATLKQLELFEKHKSNFQMVKQRGDMLFDELKLNYRSYGLVYYISLDQAYNNLEQTFFKHGLNLGLWCGSNDSLYVIIPLNADDKYFNSLREGFTKTLQDFNQRKSRFFLQTP